MKSVHFLFILTLALAASFSLISCRPIICCSTFNDTSLATGRECHGCSDSIYACCGFTVRATKLEIDGVGYFDYARGEKAPFFWGDTTVLKTNKATLHFINNGTALPVIIKFDYLDMSGINNLSINGSLFSGELNAVPASLGDVNINVTSSQVTSPANGKKGVITLEGAIKDFKIGGLEFYLDNICFKHRGKFKAILIREGKWGNKDKTL